jgi:hypothetical protein
MPFAFKPFGFAPMTRAMVPSRPFEELIVEIAALS